MFSCLIAVVLYKHEIKNSTFIIHFVILCFFFSDIVPEDPGLPLWQEQLEKLEKGLFFPFGLEKMEKFTLLIKILPGKAGFFPQENMRTSFIYCQHFLYAANFESLNIERD